MAFLDGIAVTEAVLNASVTQDLLRSFHHKVSQQSRNVCLDDLRGLDQLVVQVLGNPKVSSAVLYATVGSQVFLL